MLLRRALRDTLPVMTGYLFLGFGFGILLQQNGYGLLWALGMSLFIYAGSMQYVAVELLASGAGLLTAALTTLLVNARHLFYGLSMLDTYKEAGKKRPYLIFSLTDETFSLLSGTVLPEGEGRHRYCLLVSLLDQAYWVAGSLLGSLAGSVLPLSFEGIDFVLTALFVTMFVEQWLSSKNHAPALVGVGAALVSLLLFGAELFLVPTMLLIAGLLALMAARGKGGER